MRAYSMRYMTLHRRTANRNYMPLMRLAIQVLPAPRRFRVGQPWSRTHPLFRPRKTLPLSPPTLHISIPQPCLSSPSYILTGPSGWGRKVRLDPLEGKPEETRTKVSTLA